MTTNNTTALKWSELPIAALRKAPWNYKTDDANLLGKLVENIRRNRIVQNLVVRPISAKEFEVVNGNHRLDALIVLGMEKVMCCVVPINDISEAKRLAIELNQTSFAADPIRLGEAVAELMKVQSADELAKSMPYTGRELTTLARMADFDFESLRRSATGTGGPKATAAGNVLLKVHLSTEEARDFEEVKGLLGKATDGETLVALVAFWRGHGASQTQGAATHTASGGKKASKGKETPVS